MRKPWLGSFAVWAILSVGLCSAQTASFQKNFTLFKDVAPGIDFYAKSKSDIAPFESPVRAAREKAKADVAAAQKDLLQLLTPDQEAVLVVLGYID